MLKISQGIKGRSFKRTVPQSIYAFFFYKLPGIKVMKDTEHKITFNKTKALLNCQHLITAAS